MFGETSNLWRKGIITLNHLEDRHNYTVKINNKTLGSNKETIFFCFKVLFQLWRELTFNYFENKERNKQLTAFHLLC